MAFYTPHGLKIRLTIPHAFTLMARLFPRRTPAAILFLTGGLEDLPSVCWNTLALVGLAHGASTSNVLGLAVTGAAAGTMIVRYGLFVIPGLTTLGLWWTHVPWLARVSAPLVAAYGVRRWSGVWLWLAAYLAATVTHYGLDFFMSGRLHKRAGIIATFSEVAFIQAYRLHAAGLGESTNIDLTREELTSDRWREVALECAEGNPGRLHLPDVADSGP